MGVKTVYRLVQNEEIRLTRQSHGNPQALFHAKGKMLRLFLSGLFKPGQFQQFRDPVIGWQAQNQILLFEIILRRHIHVDGRSFHHGPYAAAGLDDVFAVITDAVQLETAGCGFLQTADQAEQRGLAGSVLSHKAIDRAFRNPHCEAV